MDQPSDLTQFYKMMPNLSKFQIQKLDQARHAVKSMWSPSKDDVKTRLYDEFGQVDFSIDDIELYYSLFPDVNTIKGGSQLCIKLISIHHSCDIWL